MARYTGPKTKIARKFGEAIFGDDKAFEKRNYPPGQHGNNKRRGKKSEYAIQLMEKQKAKYTYGILERQFRNLFKKATAASGITGEVLLQLCESRLDNVVYRMAIAHLPAELDKEHLATFCSFLKQSNSQSFVTCVEPNSMLEVWGATTDGALLNVDSGQLTAKQTFGEIYE